MLFTNGCVCVLVLTVKGLDPSSEIQNDSEEVLFPFSMHAHTHTQ